MHCLYILLTPESVQYGVGFFSTLPLFHGTVLNRATSKIVWMKISFFLTTLHLLLNKEPARAYERWVYQSSGFHDWSSYPSDHLTHPTILPFWSSYPSLHSTPSLSLTKKVTRLPFSIFPFSASKFAGSWQETWKEKSCTWVSAHSYHIFRYIVASL